MEAVTNLIAGELFAIQVLEDQLVVRLGCRLNQLGAGRLGFGLVFGRDGPFLPFGPQVGLHIDQADDALESVGLADGNLKRHDFGVI